MNPQTRLASIEKRIFLFSENNLVYFLLTDYSLAAPNSPLVLVFPQLVFTVFMLCGNIVLQIYLNDLSQ